MEERRARLVIDVSVAASKALASWIGLLHKFNVLSKTFSKKISSTFYTQFDKTAKKWRGRIKQWYERPAVTTKTMEMAFLKEMERGRRIANFLYAHPFLLKRFRPWMHFAPGPTLYAFREAEKVYPWFQRLTFGQRFRAFMRAPGLIPAGLRITRSLTLTALRIATAAAAIGAVRAIMKASDTILTLDKRLAEVAALLPEVTKGMSGFRSALLSMSITFGHASEDLAKGLYDIVSAGIPLKDSLKVLSTASMGAVATVSNIETVSKLVTRALTIFQMPVEKASHVMDVLYWTVKHGIGRLEDFMNYPVAWAAGKLAGVDFELTSALATAMTKVFKEKRGFTYLARFLEAIAFPRNEQARRILKEELPPFDREHFAEFLRILGEAINASESRREAVKLLFPNIRAMRGLAALLPQIPKIQKILKDMVEGKGAAVQAFAKMQKWKWASYQRLKMFAESTRHLMEEPSLVLNAFWYNIVSRFNEIVAGIGGMTPEIRAIWARTVLQAGNVFRGLDITMPSRLAKEYRELTTISPGRQGAILLAAVAHAMRAKKGIPSPEEVVAILKKMPKGGEVAALAGGWFGLQEKVLRPFIEEDLRYGTKRFLRAIYAYRPPRTFLETFTDIFTHRGELIGMRATAARLLTKMLTERWREIEGLATLPTEKFLEAYFGRIGAEAAAEAGVLPVADDVKDIRKDVEETVEILRKLGDNAEDITNLLAGVGFE